MRLYLLHKYQMRRSFSPRGLAVMGITRIRRAICLTANQCRIISGKQEKIDFTNRWIIYS